MRWKQVEKRDCIRLCRFDDWQGRPLPASNNAEVKRALQAILFVLAGSTRETTLTCYNKMLQATNVFQPDGSSVTNEYHLTGALKRQYGSRTYPVGYGYDYAGRMNTMTNWSSFPSSGARVTTWNYNLG